MTGQKINPVKVRLGVELSRTAFLLVSASMPGLDADSCLVPVEPQTRTLKPYRIVWNS